MQAGAQHKTVVIDFNSPANTYGSPLLNLIIEQAAVDQMDRVRITLQEHNKNVKLEYGRSQTEEWWDMTAPPKEVFLALLGAALSRSILKPGRPFTGSMLFPCIGGPLQVTLVVGNLEHFELQW